MFDDWYWPTWSEWARWTLVTLALGLVLATGIAWGAATVARLYLDELGATSRAVEQTERSAEMLVRLLPLAERAVTEAELADSLVLDALAYGEWMRAMLKAGELSAAIRGVE